MCASIDITTDILPEECTEEFRVSIIDVSSQSGICLLQDTATVVINDDDGKSYQLINLLLLYRLP